MVPMKKAGSLHILMILLPWLTIPLIGKKPIKRYFLSSFLMSLFLIMEFIYAEKKKWWQWLRVYRRPNFLGGLPLIFGPFLIGSVWILKYTYGKFKLYLLVNIIVDSLFTYLGTDWLRKLGFATLVRLNQFQLSLLFLLKSFLLYGFQILSERGVHRKK
jgi:hypothetical protein